MSEPRDHHDDKDDEPREDGSRDPVDEAIEESFPASDPPAWTPPGSEGRDPD